MWAENRRAVDGSQVQRVLKVDALGRVELWKGSDGGLWVQRVACGGRFPGSAWVARILLRRERRALVLLAGTPGVPEIVDPRCSDSAQGRDVLARTYLKGLPLHEAEWLPRDFFECLEHLVASIHRRGVCHNDLHKEQNVIVGEDGRPALIDFQLASCHRRRGSVFRSRASEDLRHVDKHRRRYLRQGRKKEPPAAGHAARPKRSAIAWVWIKTGKPAYNVLAGALGLRDREPRRPSSGPWPRWGPPIGSQAGNGKGCV